MSDAIETVHTIKIGQCSFLIFFVFSFLLRVHIIFNCWMYCVYSDLIFPSLVTSITNAQTIHGNIHQLLRGGDLFFLDYYYVHLFFFSLTSILLVGCHFIFLFLLLTHLFQVFLLGSHWQIAFCVSFLYCCDVFKPPSFAILNSLLEIVQILTRKKSSLTNHILIIL